MSRPRTIERPHPVSRSLRLRAVAREKEIDKAWGELARIGFPVAAFAGVTRRGRLPLALRKALTAFARDRFRAEKRANRLQAKIKAIYPDERRYDTFGEIRMIARVKGHVMLRRPGRSMRVCTEREWENMSRDPVPRVTPQPRLEPSPQ
jgi:hypothetical protein